MRYTVSWNQLLTYFPCNNSLSWQDQQPVGPNQITACYGQPLANTYPISRITGIRAARLVEVSPSFRWFLSHPSDSLICFVKEKYRYCNIITTVISPTIIFLWKQEFQIMACLWKQKVFGQVMFSSSLQLFSVKKNPKIDPTKFWKHLNRNCLIV